MNSLRNSSFQTVATAFLIIALTSINYQTNFLNFADSSFFKQFQRDSESLILGGIIADEKNMDKDGAKIGFMAFDGKFDYPQNILDGYVIFENPDRILELDFWPYKSLYGVQGVFYSKIHKLFSLNKIEQLQMVSSLLLAIVIFLISYLYTKIYGKTFAIIFLFTMTASPWVVSFARNLYWAEFLWFLPGLISALLYLTKDPKKQYILLVAITISIFLKSLAGYEYLSTITLFTSSVFFLAPFFESPYRGDPARKKMFFMVFGACIIGFILALIFHARMRGENIILGLQNIYEQDVKRRTYGNPGNFKAVYGPSLTSSPFDVIDTYFTKWSTPLVSWISGRFFTYLVGLAVLGVLYKYVTKHPTKNRDAALVIFFLITTCSWFILAKAHSYVHTHLNFVLWYFGFVQAIIFVTLESLRLIYRDIAKTIKKVELNAIGKQ